MSLQFIFGSSGSGKSHILYEKMIAESMEHEDLKYIVLVPEQFTMQTQKKLVSMHPRHGIMNMDAISFRRLAYRVFEEVGEDTRTVLEETGKSLVLRKLAEENKKSLNIYGSALKKNGMIQELKSAVSELAQYNIGPEELKEMAAEASDRPLLAGKLQDLTVLYEAFQKYKEGRFITAEEILDVLSQAAPDSDYLAKSVIALDGYTGFTPVQMKLMKELLKYCPKILVTVTIDSEEDFYKPGEPQELFQMSRQMIHGLLNEAKEAGVKVEDPIILGKRPIFRFRSNPELDFLERHLFRYDRSTYEKEPESLKITTLPNPMEEVRFTAREIQRLIREEKYRYEDIAVVTGDLGTYSGYVEKIFEDCQIPCFVDHKRSILLNPFIEFIRSFLDMADQNYDYKSVFRFLRCGLFDLKREEIDMLENYCIALGIRGRKNWLEPFVRTYKGFEEEKLLKVNEIKERFISTADPAVQALKARNVTVKERTLALYDFLVKNRLQEKLKGYEEYFKNRGELAFAREYAQIYKIVIELFDKLVDLLGDEKIRLKEYREVLDAGFEEAKVGVIPPSLDQVVAGDIERTRLGSIKALFFLGVNEGKVPKSGEKGGLISEEEREYLNGGKSRIAPGSRERMYIQRFYLYLSLTKPDTLLYLTLSKSGAEGKALRPSFLIGQMLRMFPKLKVAEEEAGVSRIDRIVSCRDGEEELLKGIRRYREGERDEAFKELFGWYLSHDEWRQEALRLADAAFHVYAEKGISKAVSSALYGRVLENSVSRLEKFAACAFAHFMDYGLRLQERQEYSFAAVDMGNIFHTALELFSKKLEASSYSWFELPKEISERFIGESVEETVADYGNTILKSSARNAYIAARITRMMRRTIWALSEQVKKGKFVPSSFEVSFSMAEHLDAVNIALSENEKMRLRGRIDRTDIYETEDKIYVKVIDYKSGSTAFDLLALYHGLQLQLVVYMNAALELEQRMHPDKQAVPAGMFYYNIKDPVVPKAPGETPEMLNERILKELKVNGLVNSDPEAVSGLDQEFTGSSSVIPVALNKNGSYSKTSSVADEEQFGSMAGFVNRKMAQLGASILEGRTEARPYEMGGRTACDYCPYQAVCGFDRRIEGYELRRLGSLKPEEIWKRMADSGSHEEREEEA